MTARTLSTHPGNMEIRSAPCGGNPEGRLTIDCPAKINLALSVGERREDGFHEVAMLMQSVDLCDTVSLVPRGGGIRVECDNPAIPADRRNIAYRAAELFFASSGIGYGAELEITKRIPAGAGLAGGSADAAGALLLLNRAFGLPFSREELMKIGASVGSDVPFCLEGGLALARGRGEIITPLPPLPNFSVSLLTPDFEVSTKWAYDNYRPESGADVSAPLAAVMSGDFAALAKAAFNDLESVTARKYPEIAEYKARLLSEGAAFALMSGSAPGVFGASPANLFVDRLI